MMDIKTYQDWFHDGSLEEIIYLSKTHLVLTMTSSEIVEGEEEFDEKIELSQDRVIVGKLHLVGLEKIIVNNQPYSNFLKKRAEEGDIFSFDILDNQTVQLHIIWSYYDLSVGEIGSDTIIFKANNIWWKNIPNLVIPE